MPASKTNIMLFHLTANMADANVANNRQSVQNYSNKIDKLFKLYSFSRLPLYGSPHFYQCLYLIRLQLFSSMFCKNHFLQM